MTTSRRDRRILGGLVAAELRVGTIGVTDPRAQRVLVVAVEVLGSLRERFKAAIDAEDEADVLAELAGAARRDALDDLRGMFRRLYAGMTAGVQLASVRGEDAASVRSLRAYLSGVTPSAIDDAGAGMVLETVASALVFFDAFIPTDHVDTPALRAEAEAVLARAEEAVGEAGAAEGVLITARTALFEMRRGVQRDYRAARELVGAALRLDDDPDRMDGFLPPFERLRRGTWRRPVDAPGAPRGVEED